MDLLGGQLAQLRPVLEGLRKYESNFTVDAKTLLQVGLLVPVISTATAAGRSSVSSGL
jgi:hypothetical protein